MSFENVMRIKFTFGFDGNLTLPIHYNHFLQAFIYINVKTQLLQLRYHNEGFRSGNKKFKLFTFSRLSGNFLIEQTKGTISFTSPVKLTVSSIEDALLSSFLDEVMFSGDLYLNGTKLRIDGFEPVIPRLTSTDLQIEMLSPLTVYRTEQRNGKKYTHYFSPWEDGFGQLVASNLIEKYRIFHQDEHLGKPEISVVPMFNDNPKFQKIIRFKATIIKGWMGTFRFQAPMELIEYAYYAGIGAKNSEGFGCFRVFGSGES